MKLVYCFYTFITCGKTIFKYKEWYWFLCILFLFDFINSLQKRCCAVTCCRTADLGNAMFCSHSLIIQLCKGFYICSLNVSLHRIIISVNFPLIYAIWWALTQSAWSYLCMNGWQRCAFSFSTHTEARVTSQWGHKHTNNISRTAPRVTSWTFHRFIWVKLPSCHIHTEM